MIKTVEPEISESTHVDALLKLVEWNSAVVAEHLATNVFADGSGSVELQKHVCLQQILRTFDLTFGDNGAKTHPFALDVEEHILALHWVAHVVDAPQSGVLVACVEGLEAVAQAWNANKV